MRKDNLELSIVICNYNTENIVSKTIKYIYKYVKNVKFEIIFVDDNSTDNSVQTIKKLFSQVIVIKNKKNLGYTKSCNLGTKKTTGRYILHLNSDTFFESPCDMEQIIDFMESDKKIGMVGCRILELNNKIDKTCRHSLPTFINIFYTSIGLDRLFPDNHSFGNYYLTYIDESKIQEVDCLGAFMLIKRSVIEKVGLLDERFFIYAEDDDFCLRIKKVGFKIFYYPKLTIRHYHGGSTSKDKLENIMRFYYSVYLYYQKYYAKNHFFILRFLAYFCITLYFLRMFLFEVIIHPMQFINLKKS